MDYSQTSMTDVAYDIMKDMKEPVGFYDLWEQVSALKGFDDEQKDQNESTFYTNITLDGRMITVGENRWDLRSRHKFEDVHIDMNDVYADEDTSEDEDDGDDSSIEDSYEDEN